MSMAQLQQPGGIGLARSPNSTNDLALALTLAESQPEALEEPGIVHIKEISNDFPFFSVPGRRWV